MGYWSSRVANQYRPGGTYNTPDFDTSSFVPNPASGAETEDCLFLNLAVPKKIFDKRDEGEGEPILFWIHGGGYTQGSKAAFGGPAGLIAHSQKDGDL
jgi:carboxylesterase type B